MKTIRMKTIIYICIGMFALTACEDVIQVELRDENKDLYVVDASITTAENPHVVLSKSVHVSQELTFNTVSSARVMVMDNIGNGIELSESDSLPGLYLVPKGQEYLGQVNRTYTLTIELPDDTLTAVESLVPVVPIDSIAIYPSLRGDKIFLAIFTFGNEPEGLGDYYKWDIYKNFEFLYELEYMAFASDELVDGNYVMANEIFTDFHDPNEPSERMLNLGDTIFVVQKSMSEFAYNYYLEILSQSANGSMFSVPPANLPTNVVSSKGKDVLGVFMAHDVSVSNVVVIDQTIENQLTKL